MQLKDIKTIGITGSGVMGSGIAQIFARKGYSVITLDLNDDLLAKSKKLVDIYNDSLCEEDIITKKDAEQVVAKISYTTKLSDLAVADLIIEAIVEKMDIKQQHWKDIEAIAKKDAFFATNTSGLSINQISEKLNDKTRFIGMHFWNPPHLIPLVELIRTDSTSDTTVEVLKALIKGIDKEPVIVKKDAPGFIGNRLQFAAFREAMHIVNEGIADPEDVDKAMKYGPGFRYPIIGPLETSDLGGLDTFYYISSYLFKALSDTKEVPQILVDKMNEKKLGVKTKEGFYDYSNGKDEEIIKHRDKMLFKMLKNIYKNS